MRYLLTWLFLLCAVCPFQIFAQSNFEPAYIILTSGDTVKGQIDNRDWTKNPDRITFKTESGATTRYTATDLRSFRINSTGESYEAAIVSIDKTSLKEQDVLNNVNLRGVVKDTTFLRRLTSGRITLYNLTDENSRLHLIVKKNNTLEELRLEKKRVQPAQESVVNDPSRVNQNNAATVVTVDRFRGQLAALTSDCPNEKFSVDKVAYTEKSVLDLVKRYNKCFGGSDVEDDTAGGKSNFSLSLIGGVNYSMLRVQLPPGGGLSGTDTQYGPEIMPIGGFAGEIVSPRNRGRLSWYGDLMFRYYSMEEKYKATQLKLSLLVRFNIPLSNEGRPFVGVGLTNALALAMKVPFSSYREHEQGIAAEAGYKMGKVSSWVRYERTNGFSPSDVIKTTFNLWYLGVSYRLK